METTTESGNTEGLIILKKKPGTKLSMYACDIS